MSDFLTRQEIDALLEAMNDSQKGNQGNFLAPQHNQEMDELLEAFKDEAERRSKKRVLSQSEIDEIVEIIKTGKATVGMLQKRADHIFDTLEKHKGIAHALMRLEWAALLELIDVHKCYDVLGLKI